jgi:hypothetical protein
MMILLACFFLVAVAIGSFVVASVAGAFRSEL